MEPIRYYVKGAFQGVEETPAVLEQQEELVADITAKVEDLVSEGRTREEALGIAIASVGDLAALVAEFRSDQDSQTVTPSVQVVPITEVHASDLDFHVVLLSIGITAVLMLICTVLMAVAGGVDPGTGITIFIALALAGWQVRSARQEYNGAAKNVMKREQVYRPKLLKALGTWAVVSLIALTVNLVSTDYGIWFWVAWIALAALPIRVLVERGMVRRGMFVASEAETANGVVNRATA